MTTDATNPPDSSMSSMTTDATNPPDSSMRLAKQLKAAQQKIQHLEAAVLKLKRQLKDPRYWVFELEDLELALTPCSQLHVDSKVFDAFALCEICEEREVHGWSHHILWLYGCKHCGSIVCERCTCECLDKEEEV